MMKKSEKIVLSGKFEDVIELDNHYYIRNKLDRVCVLPYTIKDGLLESIGVVEYWNSEERESYQTLLSDYVSTDDGTDLVGANRILFSIAGVNITDAARWMYLGNLFNSLTSDSPIKVYCVNVSDIEFKDEVEDEETKKKFKFIETSKVTQTDDIIFLGAFNRLFNFFYINSIK